MFSRQTHYSGTMKPRVLILFDYDWDEQGFKRLESEYDFDRAGFDLFEFPSNARLVNFNIERFVDRLVRRHRANPYSAVISNHEQFGALAAALFAEKTGLAGPSVVSILSAQHKLWMRTLLEQVCPQANIRFRPLDCDIGDRPPQTSGWPLFVKPIKAAYSVLARTCHSQDDLEALTKFSWHEKWVIRKLVEPFDKLRRARLPEAPSAHRMLMEQAIEGQQFNLDGYFYQGRAFLLGMVDELMYPGTQAFLRFHYPSQLSAQMQAKALAVAQTFLNHVGFNQSFFNLEFFVEKDSGEIKVIEFNPRLGSQLADLYGRVDGVDVYAMQLALAQGKDPANVPRRATEETCAASFVFRKFDGAGSPPALSATAKETFKARFSDALLFEFRKSEVGLQREYKWLGSHRYGVMHLGAINEAQLKQRYLQACQLLSWPPGPQFDSLDT
jgi:hypothetical protein